MIYKHFILAGILAAGIAAPTTNNKAVIIKLHASPSAESMVVSDIALSQGITILPSTWIQVQDPKTKKIGWITQQELQNIIQNNNTIITTRTNNVNGGYSSITETHNFTTNDIQHNNKDIADNLAADQQKIKHAFKKNMHYFQKMGEITNNIFDNILGENS
jgi:hypothetical protein